MGPGAVVASISASSSESRLTLVVPAVTDNKSGDYLLDAHVPECSFRKGELCEMANHEPRTPPGESEGGMFLGTYELGPALGSGAMGTVIKARHLRGGWDVAIKFLHLRAEDGTDLAARFFREAKMAHAVASKHVVGVTDVGICPGGERRDRGICSGGEAYIIMEHLEGCNLAFWLRDHRPMPLLQVAEFMTQICEAVGRVHRQGIIHRDMKPENLFVVQQGNDPPLIKVLDFGIAKYTRVVSPTLDPAYPSTADHGFVGTPPYMSPEQLNGSPNVDWRADIWALGVILFQLVTGERPYEGDLVTLCAKVAAPLHPRARFPEMSLDVEHIILRCLQVDRARRFQSADALAQALAVLRVDPMVPTLPSVQPDSPRPSLSPSAPLTPVPSRRSRTPQKAMALLVAVVGTAVVVAHALQNAPSNNAKREAPAQAVAVKAELLPVPVSDVVSVAADSVLPDVVAPDRAKPARIERKAGIASPHTAASAPVLSPPADTVTDNGGFAPDAQR